jgi:radical SAM superfamily enzyme YgiQ (UPF0313 family)
MHHALIFSLQNVQLSRNLGAHRIAQFLRDNDWDVEVIDYGGFIPLKYLKQIAKDRITSHTIFVGFSDPWGTWSAKSEIIERFKLFTDYIKEKYPQIKILLGSQKVNSSPIKADYFIEGYGEGATLAVIQHMLGTGSERLRYTLYKSGKLIRGSDYPSLHLKRLSVRYEDRDFIHPNDQLGIEWSRGCKFTCDFCNFFPLGVKGDNFRDVQDYIDDLKYIKDHYGVTTYYCADSTANVSPEKLELFANETQKQLDFVPWICAFTRVDLMISQPETWDIMIKMGYTGHHYGIETLNHEAGKAIKKGMHPDKIKEGLLQIDKYFSERSLYRTRISVIAGLPYETIDSFLTGLNWIYDNLPRSTVISFPLWIPNPNRKDHSDTSLISENYEKYGYIDLDEGNNTTALSMNWANTITNTTHQEVYELILNHPSIAQRPYYTNPWLLGEFRLATGSSLEEAANTKWVDTREVIIGHSTPEVQHYSNDGMNFYLKDYLSKKLEYY